MTKSNRRHLGNSLNPIPGVPEVLFLQGKLVDQPGIAKVATEEQIGTIFTLTTRMGRVTNTREQIRTAVESHRALLGGDATILIDANLYHGNNRRSGTATLDPDWIDFQLNDLKLPYALTDAGYIDKLDDASLDSALHQAAALAKGRPVIATIAADSTWFRDQSDRLRSAIENAGLPVALAAGHTDDPFSREKNVDGLMHLLESDVPIALSRSDLAVIGGLAAGAAFGAIGTASGLRHVYPPAKRGGFTRMPSISAVVPHARTIVSQERIRDAVALTPGQPYWHCPCDPCAGRRLDGIYGDDVYSHNLYAAAELVRTVLDDDSNRRLTTWASLCLAAQSVNMEIEANVGAWTIPDYLGAWHAAVHARIGSR